MTVRLGINPITWSNDDMPSLGGETPLEICLAEAREAGFEGIEMGNKFPREPQALEAKLAEFDLNLVSGWYSAQLLERSAEAEIEAVQKHLELLKSQGCTAMVFCEVTGCVHGDRTTPVSRRPRMSDIEWQGFCERLTVVADYLAEQGVRMAYHHHMGTVVETEEEIDRLMAGTGESVGLLLDTGHLVYAGGDPQRVIDKHGPRVNHVHCKDIRRDVLEQARAADSSFLDAVLAGAFTVPGDGFIDYPPLFRHLAALDYSGWVVVEAEQDPEKAHPLTYARMGFDYLDRETAAAGLR
ncbi:myo-inosose-2 dehydratase [Arhodomonas sp. AD133]|uniref:myo-inosose-2 dehydratase n=1 Tax=Arhodomonas sp. AD133 TaxID=3415009 RepID=UPI003EBB43BE